MTKTHPSEYQEQCVLVDYLDIKNLKYSSIPNSTYTKSHKQKMKNWRSGLRRGLPDLLVVLPDQLLFVEMKRAQKSLSKVTAEQLEWIAALNVIDNVEAIVCYGAGEAIEAIELRLHPPIKIRHYRNENDSSKRDTNDAKNNKE